MNEEQIKEEQETFKIADRRKFNTDGSLREGVNIEEPKPAAKPPEPQPAPAQPVAEATPQAETAFAQIDSDEEARGEIGEEEAFDEADIPGAENPASFANFLLSLASQAAAAMGLTENPMSGQRRADLELSRYWLDVLGMLHEKTKGNLHPQEQKLFAGLLTDLRMQYVQLTRAAEQQLKQKAATKFSGKDILGGR
jgi:hypothetical protein